MAIIIFIIVLSVLVFVHEAGHFVAAKLFGIRVDEFGLGYPPRAKRLFQWRGTDFTLNWLPFGGFVKIYGEDPSEESAGNPDSFSSKPKWKQATVLIAGVFCNFLFAVVLLSIGFMRGMPAPEGSNLPVSDSHTVITEVLKDSPAEKAGLQTGDKIVGLVRAKSVADVSTPDTIASFISASALPLSIDVVRGDATVHEFVTPENGLVSGRPGIGIAMEEVGIVKLSFFRSFYEGFRTTVDLTIGTAKALGSFLAHAVIGRADLNEVTGPVGLVGMVGQATALGFVYLLSFTALISINLSIVNLLPFPALDGGRLLFVIIEAIRRKPLSAKVTNMANTVGFGLLLLLMAVITIRDIGHLL